MAACALARVEAFCTDVRFCCAWLVPTLALVDFGSDCAPLTCLEATLLLAAAMFAALLAAFCAFERLLCAFWTATWSACTAAAICCWVAARLAWALFNPCCAFWTETTSDWL